jgi:hypothetical protein
MFVEHLNQRKENAMISSNQVQPKASLAVDAKACAAEEGVALMSANDPVEGASTGSGTVNDPGGNDHRPPNIADLELFA